MSWSLAFGALGLLESMTSKNKASSQFDQAYGFNRMAFDKTFEEMLKDSQFKKGIDELNLSLAKDERQWDEEQYADYKKQLLEERQFEIERLIKQDKEAARQYAFNLEKYLDNQELSQQERELALKELEEAKAIAQGERDEDYRRFETAKAQKEIEREFMLEEFGRSRNIAQEERNYMLAQRKNIMDRIQGMQSGLEGVYAGLQDIPNVNPVTQADIDAEVLRRTNEYTSDVDRAADRVASIAEGELISKGMDLSTQANQTRGDVASRLADEYQKARFKAYDDAMSYIGGKQGIYNTDTSNIIASRAAELEQAGGVLGSGINQMTSLPTAPSAGSYMQYASLLPTGTYDRSPTLSANTFQDKYGLTSGVNNDYLNLGSMLSSQPGASSAAGFGGVFGTVGTGQYQYQPYNWGNPQGYATNMLNSSQTNLNNAWNRATDSGTKFGGAFEDWLLNKDSKGKNA
tara:strand:+ start:1085 stop:2467 length:1383 start_codon:yes stop_codon:yes gene_type:complete